MAASSPPSVSPEMMMMAVADPQEQSTSPDTIVVNQSFQEGPLYLTVNETSVEPGQMAIAMTIENRSDHQIRFYPSQRRLSTGTAEIEANLFLSDLILSEAFAPGEQRSGVLIFKSSLHSDLDLTRLDTIHLVLGQVMNDMASSEPEYIEIKVPMAP
ncbi:MAG: hypothetical protein WBA57_05585 [Elainellaceae cyanobacterium]